MTRTDLNKAIALELNLSLPEAKHILDFALGRITKAIKAGERVRLDGFGTFESKQSKRTKARNPQTGAIMTIAPKMRRVFRAALALR